MIVVDTLAIVAIASNEAEAASFVARIQAEGQAYISAANYVEASIVIEARKPAKGRATFDSAIGLLLGAGLHIVRVDAARADLVRDSYRFYGKGRHPAGLNYGDCFAHALATELGAPLLYKGNDFDRTGVVPA